MTKAKLLTTEKDIAALVAADDWMMRVLRAAQTLALPDWWIGAGFLRNKVWDALEGNASQPSKDVDLVYFNAQDVAPETDWHYDEQLKTQFPFAEWEVRNQARMHYVNDFAPYTSTADGISHWVETATCVAVRLNMQNELEFLFCYGTKDLLGLVARPTEYFVGDMSTLFYERVSKKRWQERWPHLRVEPL
ncbi:MAG TPA: nucleotidyltransferase family protein [Candidatus Saccharimonadales bacterium]|nr:nucleotidyltransferase family protein [Candidatus Saccharimonadales bacterium]